jgi:hypothetical protein
VWHRTGRTACLQFTTSTLEHVWAASFQVPVAQRCNVNNLPLDKLPHSHSFHTIKMIKLMLSQCRSSVLAKHVIRVRIHDIVVWEATKTSAPACTSTAQHLTEQGQDYGVQAAGVVKRYIKARADAPITTTTC